MKIKLLMTVSALVLSSTMAFAALSTDSVVADLQAQGYSRIEVKTGPTQTKIEAIKGSDKLEVIYDTATGAELTREMGSVGLLESTTEGVFYDDRGRDFLTGDDNGADTSDGASDDNGGDTSGHGNDDTGGDDNGGTSGGNSSDNGDDSGDDS